MTNIGPTLTKSLQWLHGLKHCTLEHERIEKMKFILVYLLFSFSVFAAPLAPPAAKITYDEYRQLVTLKISEVPDLKNLWSWASDEGLKDVYFGGGALRGLILWININLAQTNLETVKKMQPPDISGLLIQKDADRDIYAPSDWVKKIKNKSLYSQWDIIEESFYQSTIENRGSRADKIRGNSKLLEDPLDGLRELYLGQISMDISGGPFETQNTNILGDNWLGLSLRYLRFVVEFADIADASESSLESIKQFADLKADWIPDNEDHGYELPKEKSHKALAAYRIRKALSKLYSGTKKNPFLFFQLLKELNLLELLSLKDYNVLSLNQQDLETFTKLALAKGFNFKELWLISRMHAHSVSNAVFMHKLLFQIAQTPEQIKWSLTPFKETMSDSYQERMMHFVSSSLTTEKGKKLKLTIEDLRTLGAQYSRTSTILALKKSQIPHANNGEDILKIMAPVISNPSNNYLDYVRQLMQEERSLIASKIQSPSELLRLEQAVNQVDAMIAMKKAFLPKAKSAADFIKALQPAWQTPSDSYKTQIEKLFRAEIDNFIRLKPTAMEIQDYASSLNTVEDIMKLKKSFLFHTVNPYEFETAIKFSSSRPSELYIKSSQALLNSLTEHFVKIGGSWGTWNQLRIYFRLPSEDGNSWNSKVQRIAPLQNKTNSCHHFYASLGAYGR